MIMRRHWILSVASVVLAAASLRAQAPVTRAHAERRKEQQNYLTYGGRYFSTRYSKSRRLRGNVKT